LDLSLAASTAVLAAGDLSGVWNLLLVIVQVAIGLGMVIFVHELGHFAVAKWCGVKCEKFYLGFDIPMPKIGPLQIPSRLLRFQWGETEYGIGILPLGGYVKMLGQDDSPHRTAEEMRRARVQHVPSGDLPAEPTAEEPHAYDPRSYMAQSVPKRMAIISAGVVMNVIFAFVATFAAYQMGVGYEAAVVGSTVPGGPAWQLGLLPDDRIVRIGNYEQPVFRDLRSEIGLGDLKAGVPLVIERPGVGRIERTILPTKEGLFPMIGVTGGQTTQVSRTRSAFAYSPASRASPVFEPGDVVVAIDDQPVNGFRDIQRILARNPGRSLEFVVQRSQPGRDRAAATAPQEIKIRVEPNRMRDLGIVMRMGPITAVQKDLPAEAAGIQPGDRLEAINGQPPSDPLRLDEMLRQLAESEGQPGGDADAGQVTLRLRRDGKPVDVRVALREPTTYDWPAVSYRTDVRMTAPSLGIAYEVHNVIKQVVPGSPADKQGLKPGDKIAKVELVQPSQKQPAHAPFQRQKIPIDLNEDESQWPLVIYWLQETEPGTIAVLALDDGRTVEVEPVVRDDWFSPARGLLFEPVMTKVRAESLAHGLALATRETWMFVTQVYRFLSTLGTNISIRAVGGPITIARAAGLEAFQSFPRLLIFLAMLSANLAVINFLPIPLLDGGHMVFLILEGIRGKPVPEKVFVAFHYAGFAFILMLMVFVLGLDFGLIPRQ
jgi:regulator of sigma E protease